ncbi:hypothetical protein PORY_002566 [Pneumocystis oryctolagi]|uniref:Uncharacterized protein n=1 Tax=Pneumocystis oryctolagi TaxID=42067 RepID=A0ACB7CAV7_9ASCO|nr:hypothetical protein PORY_002566 [Pneumocystis oryctolagi]
MFTSSSTEKTATAPINHQVLPSTATRPLTEDGRPLKCYVGNLSSQCRMYHLREKFSPFGTIINVELKPNIGCGFVEYVDPESCIKACNALDGTELFGQTLRVETQKQVYGIRKIVTEKLEGCFNCGAKNHWAKHCPKMPPPGTPQNVSPKSSVLPSDTRVPSKSFGHHYNMYNYGHLRHYPDDLPYRQPCLNGYRNSYHHVPRDYHFRDRDMRDLRDFQKYRSCQWNPPEKLPENTAIDYKRYNNSESRFREHDKLVASSKNSELLVESKLTESLNENKCSEAQVDFSRDQNTLKESEKDPLNNKKLYNDQNSVSQDTSAIAKQEICNNNESLEDKKAALYPPVRKERPFAYCQSQHYDYYNRQDYAYPESCNRAYLVPKYPDDNLHYDHYANYVGRHAPLRMRSKYSDGYRYYYSEHYAPYDSSYRTRRSMQHVGYAPNPRMDYATLNYSQGYSRRCSPNMYSPSYNYGYSCEYR